MALLRRRPKDGRPVLAADFAHQMLVRGAAKFGGRGAVAVEADALHLPLPSGSLDLLVTAFGFRNLANYRAGLEEFYRTLKPGGELGILDFSEPGGFMGKLYALYFRRILPAVGSLALRGFRAVPIPSQLGGAVPCPRGAVTDDEICGLCRGFLDGLQLWYRGAVSRGQKLTM